MSAPPVDSFRDEVVGGSEVREQFHLSGAWNYPPRLPSFLVLRCYKGETHTGSSRITFGSLSTQ